MSNTVQLNYNGIVAKTSSPLHECVENAIACLISATEIKKYFPIGNTILPHQACLFEHGF